MYQVFNMGHRLEVFTDEGSAEALIRAGQELGIGAQVVGRVEAASAKRLELTVGDKTIVY